MASLMKRATLVCAACKARFRSADKEGNAITFQ
jgi:hypothetical protein